MLSIPRAKQMPGRPECCAKECLLGISPSSTTIRVCKLPGTSVFLSNACCSFLGGKDSNQNELTIASWFKSQYRLYNVAYMQLLLQHARISRINDHVSQYLLSQFPSVICEFTSSLRCVVERAASSTTSAGWDDDAFMSLGIKTYRLGRFRSPCSPIYWRFSAIAPRSVVLLLHRAVFQHLLQDFPDDAQALSRLGNPRGSYEFRGVRWVGRILVVALGVVNSMHELI